MEDVNVSTNRNDAHFGIDSHHFGNNKKHIDSSDATADSGYMTHWSISHNHTATSSSISTSRIGSPLVASTSGSFKKSFDLETITETFDLPNFGGTTTTTTTTAAETPTTRSIRQLNNFHINTPQNNRSQLETTPKKPNYFHNTSSGPHSAHKKKRSQNRLLWAPYESPNKRGDSNEKLRSPRKRQALFEQNDENSFDENACNQSIYFSPIKSHNNSNIVQRTDSPMALQRHPSGIGTSTPKFTLRRTHTHSIIHSNYNDDDRHLIRKIKSFNPIQRDSSILKDSNVQNRPDSIDQLDENEEQPIDNPVKKVLAFSSQQFEKLVLPQPVSVPKTPNKATTTNTVISMSPRKGRQQSRLIREFSKKKTMRPTIITPKKKTEDSFNECDISMTSVTNDDFYSPPLNPNFTNELFAGNFSLSAKTPSINKNLTNIDIDTPTRNDSISNSIREEANRTPTKRFERSMSYSHIKSSPEKEKNKILYSALPCTPPKMHVRRPLKRQASSLADTSHDIIEPSAKRKLYGERTMFYDGIETLDILTRLSNDFEVAHVTEKILSHLNGKQLHAAYCVSKSWSSVVDGCTKSRSKRLKYVRDSESIKENIFESMTEQTIINNNNDVLDNKSKPFHLFNKKEVIPEMIPVSPRTQRFRDHIKLTEKLEPNQHIILCSVCPGKCIVYPNSPEKSRGRRKSTRTRIHQMLTTTNDDKFTIKNRRNGYATCQSCGYSICLRCNRKKHENSDCIESPISDDDTSQTLSNPRKSKRILKSNLKRLAF